ncbi:hypothetical protein SGLAU_21415 [Streptomyces glaucescens]|uniref:Uncharacterized protein n=1 Tax=Streptomyces glaucescens TaxID=1907 RepID=A0A089XE90_STRGA|nr:hypothetical protein SGLAU_21415 [Streptomyces glaucescens]
MTLRQAGGATGIALLGSLLSGAFRDRLDVAGLPPQAADTAGESVVAVRLVAERSGAPGLIASANGAYAHGTALVLLVCALASLVSALLVAGFLPGARSAPAAPDMATPAADAGQ